MRSLLWFIPSLCLLSITATAEAANPDHVKRLLRTNQCTRCDLSEADLRTANLFGANLVGANLQGANLSGANLGSANLTDANLSGANLTQAYLFGAVLDSTNLSNANLQSAYLRDATLVNVNISGANLTKVNLSRTNLGSVQLAGADLSGANLSDTSFVDVRISGASPNNNLRDLAPALFTQSFCLTDTRSNSGMDEFFRSLKSSGITLLRGDLTGTNLSNANLQNAMMANLSLDNADLTNANMNGTILRCSSLKNAKLDGADLKDAVLEAAVLEGASTTGIQNASLENIAPGVTEQQMRAYQSEGRTIVGSMNRAQQAYFLERERFASTLKELQIGVPDNTERYQYRVFSYPQRNRAVMVAGIPKNKGFKTYIGLISVGGANPKERLTFATICESEVAKPLLPQLPPMPTGQEKQAMACPEGFKKL